MLPTSLTLLLTLALPSLTASSPSPPYLLSDAYTHLVPRHTLFFRQTSNLQTFASALGGFAASPIENSGDAERPFAVEGETFTDFEAAAQRSCDRQFKRCSDAANAQGGDAGLSVGDCDEQKAQCNDTQQNAAVRDFNGAVATTNEGPDGEFPDFDLICDV